MKKTSKTTQKNHFPMPLNKYLSWAGICSRRQAVEYIKIGHVKVNGNVVQEPGHKVVQGDQVTFKNKKIMPDEKIYLLLNKPRDYVTTVADDKGRRTVIALVIGVTTKRVHPVGRLDRTTTGLLLLTNDGDLTQKLAHPRNEVKKVYSVVLDRPLSVTDLQSIREGIKLSDGIATVDTIGYAPGERKNCVKVRLHSGKNRIIRRIFEYFDYRLLKLDRINYAGLTKRGLPLGRCRALTEREVRVLKTYGQVLRPEKEEKGKSRVRRKTTQKNSDKKSRSERSRVHKKNGRVRSKKTGR